MSLQHDDVLQRYLREALESDDYVKRLEAAAAVTRDDGIETGFLVYSVLGKRPLYSSVRKGSPDSVKLSDMPWATDDIAQAYETLYDSSYRHDQQAFMKRSLSQWLDRVRHVEALLKEQFLVTFPTDTTEQQLIMKGESFYPIVSVHIHVDEHLPSPDDLDALAEVRETAQALYSLQTRPIAIVYKPAEEGILQCIALQECGPLSAEERERAKHSFPHAGGIEDDVLYMGTLAEHGYTVRMGFYNLKEHRTEDIGFFLGPFGKSS